MRTSIRNNAPRGIPRALIAGLIGTVAMLLGANASSALEFAKHPSDSDTVNAIEVKGKFEAGDAVALQAYIAKLPIKRVTTVYLDSLGGSFEEGMALGRFFNRAKIRTVVGAGVTCTSACTTAFLGGRDAETGKPWRAKGSTARLGFHSFRLNWADKDYTAEDIRSLVSTNVEGFVYVTQLAVKQMLAQKTGGSIVTITAALARNPIRGVTAAVPMITKGGLETITQHLAMEYAKDGIRVNAVAPGVVETPMHRNTPKDVMKGLSPMGRPSTVKDITDAVMYLTDAATVTGDILYVDGGAHFGRW
jgi:NAD(P)-dependent dehydrogenase (short-subunit alcohol dehydrogenase family)